jgi:microsomal epoxide hydrolase
MSKPFRNATIPVTPFKISHTQQEIDNLRTLLRLSPLGPTTYENSPSRPTNFGISMSQMTSLRSEWLEYDWFATEKELNERYPQYIAKVEDVCPKSSTSRTMDIHFIGYESGDADAVPVLLLHGWPGMGCFELAPMIEHLQKYSKRPLNVIVPRQVSFPFLRLTFLFPLALPHHVSPNLYLFLDTPVFPVSCTPHHHLPT